MKFSLNWIKEYVDVKEPPDKLADLLTLKSAEVKEAVQDGKDTIFDIDVLPNRSDLLSHVGFAKELSVLLGSKFKMPSVKIKENSATVADAVLGLKVEDKKYCPRYSARIVEGVKVGPSPAWLAGRLASLGLRPINNIVDVTNYVMLELGQPLHAFDFHKIDGQSIHVRMAKKGEKLTTLDEGKTELELDKNTLVIADTKKPIALAGIKGGVGTEITPSTRSIVIESANFDPALIRQTSAKLNLRTDASIRFSYGVDPNLTAPALDRACEMIATIAKGKTAKGMVDFYPFPRVSGHVSLSLDYLNSMLGLVIPEAEVEGILRRLFVSVVKEKNGFKVEVPTSRPDITRQDDVVEEIARVYGYDKIPALPPMGTLYPQEPPLWEKGGEFQDSILWDTSEAIHNANAIRDIFKGLGFTEVINYSFLSDEMRELFMHEKIVELMNPISHEMRYLRPSLFPNLLQAAARNLRFFDSFSIFEVGKIFENSLPDGHAYLPAGRVGNSVKEKSECAGVHAGSGNVFSGLKGILESLFEQLGITDYLFEEGGLHLAFHPGKHAIIMVNNSPVGEMGEVNPKILNSLGISGTKIAMFRFDMTKLLAQIREEQEFSPLSKYPSVVRDIAILTDADVKINQILNQIEEADILHIVKDVDVFDIYEDTPSLPEGKKSVAFHVIFQSDDRTLTDAEVRSVEDNIKKMLETNLGAEVR